MTGVIKERYQGLSGCTLEEIALLEQSYGLRLPAPYVAFLEVAGRDAENYEIGSEYQFCHLHSLKSAANLLLAANNRAPLPDDAFVFWMHQGYQFCFFLTDVAGSDPFVYYYNECFEIQDFLKISSPLSEFMCAPSSFINKALEQGGHE